MPSAMLKVLYTTNDKKKNSDLVIVIKWIKWIKWFKKVNWKHEWRRKLNWKTKWDNRYCWKNSWV